MVLYVKLVCIAWCGSRAYAFMNSLSHDVRWCPLPSSQLLCVIVCWYLRFLCMCVLACGCLPACADAAHAWTFCGRCIGMTL